MKNSSLLSLFVIAGVIWNAKAEWTGDNVEPCGESHSNEEKETCKTFTISKEDLKNLREREDLREFIRSQIQGNNIDKTITLNIEKHVATTEAAPTTEKATATKINIASTVASTDYATTNEASTTNNDVITNDGVTSTKPVTSTNDVTSTNSVTTANEVTATTPKAAVDTTKPDGKEKMTTSTPKVKKVISKQDCEQASYNFTGEPTNYAVINTTMPDMDKMSICAWIEPLVDDTQASGTMLSYNNDKSENKPTLLIFFKEWPTDMYVYVNGQKYDLFYNEINKNTFVCFLIGNDKIDFMQFSSRPPPLIAYIKCTPEIKGSGKIYVGLDQTSITQTGTQQYGNPFKGTIKNLRIWNKILNLGEIQCMAEDETKCLDDYIIDMAKVNAIQHPLKEDRSTDDER